jgi:hypothetical protein
VDGTFLWSSHGTRNRSERFSSELRRTARLDEGILGEIDSKSDQLAEAIRHIDPFKDCGPHKSTYSYSNSSAKTHPACVSGAKF